MQKQTLDISQTQPPVAADRCKFNFHGASRFEAPEIGRLFRSNGASYRVEAILSSSRNFLADFDKVWTFVTECQRIR